jgi:hypothetical protein
MLVVLVAVGAAGATPSSGPLFAIGGRYRQEVSRFITLRG